MIIKIYGYGWVGKAMHTLFPVAQIHDPFLGFINKEPSDVAFICVPTPLITEGYDKGKLDTSIVEEVVKDCDADLIIIRSTVNPGTCDYLAKRYEKNIVFQPEYLGETVSHPLTDQKARPFIIIGGRPDLLRKTIEVYQTVYNANVNIRQVSLYEAEIIKLTENRAIAFKVMQCQELYDVCEEFMVDYYTIAQAVYGDDPRFNLYWTFIFPENRGFNSSKCLAKDVPAWCAWAESIGVDPKLTKALVDRSNEYETERSNSKL